MKSSDLNILEKLSLSGVVHRDEVKNYGRELKKLIKSGFVKGAWKKGYVYYELTQKSLPLLEERRQQLWHLAKLKHLLSPSSQVYWALVEDIRFLNVKHPEAKKFQFLGDWQLKRPCVSGQLTLAQYRYYREKKLV
ncbi:MAG: hypothetical protein HQM15_05265 [Deltaproteobacteria bacterium]|nr:hypothetical protein [Deltaproteobacteria bacterium]